jgi:CheY-like chemotaxis protein
MPKISGIELLRWIKDRAELENIPVVMQTGMGTAENIREGIEAGAYYYLVKPVIPELLESIVSAAVNDYRERMELLRKLKEHESPFKTLQQGLFRFRTLEEGEFLAVRIANLSSSTHHLLGLSEMITNAIEHGNLGISYEEKGKLMASGTWHAEIQRRLSLPEYCGKHVSLSLSRENGKLIVVIEDEGEGFDYRRYLKMDENRVFDNHGRGIALACQCLDVKFLGNGNTVQLTIPL